MYSKEQIAEIEPQLPTNIANCKSRIKEVDAQLAQYDELILALKEKIARVD